MGMCGANVSYDGGKVIHAPSTDESAQCWIAAATPKTQDEQRCLDQCKCAAIMNNTVVDCKTCAEQHGTDAEMTACMRGYSKIQAGLEIIPNDWSRDHSKDGSISPNTVADAVVGIVGLGKEQTIDIKSSHHDAGHWE